jgi:hypothetical protein
MASLPRSSRAIWNIAQSRVFNVAIQAGTRPYSYELHLQSNLEAIAGVRAQLAVTVYAPEPLIIER